MVTIDLNGYEVTIGEDGRLRNPEGFVAMVRRSGGNSVYKGTAFIPKYGISMAWIPPGLVGQCLRKKSDCCNQGVKMFACATEGQVRMYVTGRAR